MKRVRASEQRLFSLTTFSVMFSVVMSFIGGISLGMGAHRGGGGAAAAGAATAGASGVDMFVR